jgi:soluble cytochrome b562
MNKRLLPLTLALTVLFPAAALIRADDPPAPAEKAPQHEHKEPETELGKTMEKLNGAWRKLRKQVNDPASNANSIEQVAIVKESALKAETLQPDKAKDLPEADRPKFIQAYQEKMKEFAGKLDKLTAAFKANDNTSAAALLKELGQMQREGHKEYKRPDK